MSGWRDEWLERSVVRWMEKRAMKFREDLSSKESH